jgi:CHAT domain-containing protein
LVEYIAGRGGEPVTAFVITRERVRVVSLAPDDTLRSMGRRLATLLPSNTDAGQLAARLGALALGPVLQHVPSDAIRLVIVPDGGMHRVPLEALRMPDGRWLVDRFAVATAPSATAFVRLAANGAEAAEPGTALVFGDPVLGRRATPGSNGEPSSELQLAFANAGALTRLPWSAREARAVGRYFPDADVRVGSEATEAALRTATRQGLSVLHLATHALVDDQVIGRSAIALAPGGGHDGFVSAAELATLALRVDLVVLSGCRTAQGAVFIGEGVQGLTAPLLENGARAVLATRWAIGDREANGMMVRFYDAMARGSPAGDAIREAQRAAIADRVPASVWAAFTLVGDPMVRPQLRRR